MNIWDYLISGLCLLFNPLLEYIGIYRMNIWNREYGIYRICLLMWTNTYIRDYLISDLCLLFLLRLSRWGWLSPLCSGTALWGQPVHNKGKGQRTPKEAWWGGSVYSAYSRELCSAVQTITMCSTVCSTRGDTGQEQMDRTQTLDLF